MNEQSPHNPPRYYQPLEIPAFCFIWEAVMWVSFGRFPEGNGFEDMEELSEELGQLSFTWKDSFGGPRYRFRGFWWFESEMAGVDSQTIDWDRYEGALRNGFERMDSLEGHLLMLSREPHPDDPPMLSHFVDRVELYRALCEKALAEAPYVESVHHQHQQPIDRGWSLIFQALADGKLQGYGWGDLTQDEIRERAAKGDLADYAPTSASSDDDGNVINPWHYPIPSPDLVGPLQEMGMMMEIPRKEWSLSGVAPDGRYVTATGRNWWDVCFPSEQLFALFPRPLLANTEVECDTIEVLNPGVAIGISGAQGGRHATPSTPAARGRKKLADGQIEKACQELYGARWAAGEQEAPLHAEAAAFALRVWGETLHRSTFQGYMKPFRRTKPMPETMPEIAAE